MIYMKDISKFLILLFVLIILSCNQIGENSIQQEIYSPEKNYKAIVFSRNIDATTSFNTQVSIIERDKKLPNKPGNIFVAEYVDNLDVYWSTENELHIFFPDKNIRIYKKKEEINDIKIVY